MFNLKIITLRSRVLLHNFTNLDFEIKTGITGSEKVVGFCQGSLSQQKNHELSQKQTFPIPIYDLFSFDTSNDVNLLIFLCVHTSNGDEIGKLEIPSLSRLQRKANGTVEIEDVVMSLATGIKRRSIKVTTKTRQDCGNAIVDIFLHPAIVILNKMPTSMCIRSASYTTQCNSERFNPSVDKDSHVQFFPLINQIKVELCLQNKKIPNDGICKPKGAKEITLDISQEVANESLNSFLVNGVDVQLFEIRSNHGNCLNSQSDQHQSLYTLLGTRIFSLSACNVIVDHTKELKVYCLFDDVITRSTTFRDTEGDVTLFPAFQHDFDIRLQKTESMGQDTRTILINISDIPRSDCSVNCHNLKWNDGSTSGYWVYKSKDEMVPNALRINLVASYAFRNMVDIPISLTEETTIEDYGQIDPGSTLYVSQPLDSQLSFSLKIWENENCFQTCINTSSKADVQSLVLKSKTSAHKEISMTLHCVPYELDAMIVYIIVAINKNHHDIVENQNEVSAWNRFFQEVLWKPKIFLRQILVTFDSQKRASEQRKNTEILVFDNVNICYCQTSLGLTNTLCYISIVVKDVRFEQIQPDGSLVVMISKESSADPFFKFQCIVRKEVHSLFYIIESAELTILNNSAENSVIIGLDKDLKSLQILIHIWLLVKDEFCFANGKTISSYFTPLTTLLDLKQFKISPFTIMVKTTGEINNQPQDIALFVPEESIKELFRRKTTKFDMSGHVASSELKVPLITLIKIVLTSYKLSFKPLNSSSDSSTQLDTSSTNDEYFLKVSKEEYIESALHNLKNDSTIAMMRKYKQLLDIDEQDNNHKEVPVEVSGKGAGKNIVEGICGFFTGFGIK